MPAHWAPRRHWSSGHEGPARAFAPASWRSCPGAVLHRSDGTCPDSGGSRGASLPAAVPETCDGIAPQPQGAARSGEPRDSCWSRPQGRDPGRPVCLLEVPGPIGPALEGMVGHNRGIAVRPFLAAERHGLRWMRPGIGTIGRPVVGGVEAPVPDWEEWGWPGAQVVAQRPAPPMVCRGI